MIKLEYLKENAQSEEEVEKFVKEIIEDEERKYKK